MKQHKKVSGMIMLTMVVFISVGYLSKQRIENTDIETAIEHSVKHLDPKYQCPMHTNIIKDKEGSCPICGMKLVLIDQEQKQEKAERKLLYWVAPMDANYRRDKPGKSPMGMDLVPVYDEGDIDITDRGNVVKISPSVENNMGVRTADVIEGKLSRKIETVGYVGLDESRVSHVHLRVDGWIENMAIKIEGDRVKKGQRLFDLYSPKLVNSMEEYVQALKSKNKRLISASKEKLISLGVGHKQIIRLASNRKAPRVIKVYAPQDGIVSMLSVREGMYVKPANRVMTLADLSSVWVLAEVFESQSQWVALGQAADVGLSFVPGRVWNGKVDYVYPSLDVKNRTLRVRLQFDNADEVLKPNMYASVLINGNAKNNVLSVPREALIRTGKNQRLIVAKGNGKFEQREVVAGMESGDQVEIKSGIEGGEKIVISAQFLIDSEASMKASLLRMSDMDMEK
ncbi:MAG: efflux RND transporter periplasmic adaptor subunit [endosymbiont of Galathealinum brachiosum]|uniref:Efflux RND transporter periplasmic adaptor subunit n=1 Tax=endosymbiont of Galathealinum brachiosum TaxID=2200906 RepID=A0A370DBQ7_9GAMM|nr:MAG: efflux RND transporter periplasmic adaptor subunit [endosymbiont of Galathealinum brachiosum]